MGEGVPTSHSICGCSILVGGDVVVVFVVVVVDVVDASICRDCNQSKIVVFLAWQTIVDSMPLVVVEPYDFVQYSLVCLGMYNWYVSEEYWHVQLQESIWVPPRKRYDDCIVVVRIDPSPTHHASTTTTTYD